MEDFDVFTNEINFTKPLFKNILNKYVNDVPSTPNGPNYQSGRKLMAEECLASSDDIGCAFHLSEAASASLRTMAVYRDEQLKAAGNKLHKITSYIEPVQNVIDANPIPKKEKKLLDLLSEGTDNISNVLQTLAIDKEVPFHKRYLHFSKENNVNNFQKILKELPKEWTIIQLTVPYNPNENLKPLLEYRTEVDSLYLSMFTNDYLEDAGLGPMTVHVPANVTKEGEKPLFTELFSILDENYKTIDNAQFLNNKRLVQNYWSRREDIDLRMKSVINVMDKEWLGGWGCLLTGKLMDKSWKEKIVKLVDNAILDWGFIRLTQKQKILLYNLIECSPVLQSQQIKSCIRRILTEHGNIEDIRQVLNPECGSCTKEFRFLKELCLKCLSKSFEKLHHFSLVDGIKAFSQTASIVKDGDEWSGLKKAKRHPVILIVDERLDTFPWETLPILNQHPVSRMENIHFLYYLYKVHEKNIVDGYYAAKCEVGRYVINPGKLITKGGSTLDEPSTSEAQTVLGFVVRGVKCGRTSNLQRSLFSNVVFRSDFAAQAERSRARTKCSQRARSRLVSWSTLDKLCSAHAPLVLGSPSVDATQELGLAREETNPSCRKRHSGRRGLRDDLRSP